MRAKEIKCKGEENEIGDKKDPGVGKHIRHEDTKLRRSHLHTNRSALIRLSFYNSAGPNCQ